MEAKHDKETLVQYEALVKFFQKSGLKIKEAVCFDKRVAYFRNDEFVALIQENHEQIPKILKSWEFDKPLNSEAEAKKLVTDLLENKVIWKLERGQEEPKYKWPKKLLISRDQSQQADTAFYSFVITPKSKSSRVMTFLILAAVVALCLFQIWPLKLKLAVFYTSVILLYILLGLILVRLAIYLFFRILGFDAYIFPNLFEEVSFLQSFVPFFSFEKCEDGTIGYVARAFGLVLLAFLMFKFSQEPEILQEYQDIATQSYDDIISWGVEKLEGRTALVNPKDEFSKMINDLLDAAEQDDSTKKEDKKNDEPRIETDKIEDVDIDKVVQEAVEKERRENAAKEQAAREGN